MNEAPEILLVEDDPHDEELTLHALKQHKLANRIHVVRDGAEALDYIYGNGKYAGSAQKAHPRVVLLDLKLPKVDGLTLLRHIGAKPEFLHTRLVVVSANGLAKNRAAAWLAGADAFLGKPFTFDQLHEIIDHVLGDPPPADPQRLQ